jgi:hypothetical protein
VEKEGKVAFLNQSWSTNLGMKCVMEGDWNLILSQEEMKRVYKDRGEKSVFKRLYESMEVRDLSKGSHTRRQGSTSALLDRVLVRGKWESENSIPVVCSDYDMVAKCMEKKKAKKLWRLNTQILKDNTAMKIEEMIRDRENLIQRKRDPLGWWDDTKLMMRVILQAKSKMKQQKRNLNKEILLEKLTRDNKAKDRVALKKMIEEDSKMKN